MSDVMERPADTRPANLDLAALRQARIVLCIVTVPVDGAGRQLPSRHRVGALELDMAGHRAFWKSYRVALTHLEYRVVQLLATAGRDVSHREVYDFATGRPGFVAGAGGEGYRANVRTYVKRIREKFIAIDPAFNAIRTYSGFGYKWEAA